VQSVVVFIYFRGSTGQRTKSAENSPQFRAVRVFFVSFSGLFSFNLVLKPMDSQVNAPIRVRAGLHNDKNFAVLGPGDYFHLNTTLFTAVDNHLDLVDTVIVPGQLGSLVLGVFFDSIRYVNMLASDCEKQRDSP
jgi:hypothetical protein